MEILKVSNNNFQKEVLEEEKTVLVDFYADWCGPCKMLSPIIEVVAKESTEVKFVKINVDEAQELAMQYNIMSIPTLVLIKNGTEISRKTGLVDKEEIIEMLK